MRGSTFPTRPSSAAFQPSRFRAGRLVGLGTRDRWPSLTRRVDRRKTVHPAPRNARSATDRAVAAVAFAPVALHPAFRCSKVRVAARRRRPRQCQRARRRDALGGRSAGSLTIAKRHYRAGWLQAVRAAANGLGGSRPLRSANRLRTYRPALRRPDAVGIALHTQLRL